MCSKREIAEAIKHLPFNITVEDIIYEMAEAPQVYAKCKGNFNEILYTTYVRKIAKESEQDLENGNYISLEELKEEMEGWYEDNHI